jgi:hypothetical protein
MSDSLVVDVAIGLVFTFAVFAALTSALTELIARFLGLRGDYLLRGLRALVDGDDTASDAPAAADPSKVEPGALWGNLGGDVARATLAATTAANTATAAAMSGAQPSGAQPTAQPTARAAERAAEPGRAGVTATPPVSDLLLRNALLGSQGMKNLVPAPGAPLTLAMKRDLPSYISGRSFGSAVLALLIPDASGATTMNELVADINKLPSGVLKKSLLSLAAAAAGDVDRFRTSVEAWYDDHMARVSGWYKRRVRWISIAIGAVLVIGANVSAIALSRSLYSDQAVRESVITQAIASSNCKSEDPGVCLDQTRGAIAKLRGGGLPVGWGAVTQCQVKGSSCNWLQRYGLTSAGGSGFHQVVSSMWLLLGWALTAFALMPGARFWFDILGRLGTLRSTGPKPAAA